MMKVVFMGTPGFAAYQLKELVANGINVVATVTMPDKPMGRGMKLGTSAVKDQALELGIPVLQPEKLRDPEFLDQLKSYDADVFVVVAFRMLPEVVWTMPAKGTLNLHASILPQYRGAAPINWAIINGDQETGVTTFFIQKEIDTGDIIRVDKVALDERETAGSLHDKLMELGAGTIINTLKSIASDQVQAVPQTEPAGGLKSAPKIFKEDCRIDWTKSAADIDRLVRGMSPYPTAWTQVHFTDGRILSLKVFDVFPSAAQIEEGKLESDGKHYIKVGAGSGSIELRELQLEGKKKMDIKTFLMGFIPAQVSHFS